jgi:hypothetical protein
MPALRPVQHLESVSRDYPGIWRQYARFLALRGHPDLGDWPAWCFCPMAAAYAIVSGGGERTVELGRSLEISKVAALAAWRQTQGVYRFDPTLLEELLATPIAGDLPVEHLQRLPEWCVYVELGGLRLGAQQADPQLSEPLHGFFAHLERDAEDGRTELRLLLDQDAGLIPIALHLGGTIEASIAGFVAHANMQIAKRGAPLPAMGADLIGAISRAAAPLISALLYLCSAEREARPTRDPARTHDPARLRRDADGEPYLPPARRPEVWETGFRLGAALRSAREAEARGGTVRGHVRRGHWHGFWTGPLDGERRLDVRWLPPIPVKLDVPETATVRKVRR